MADTKRKNDQISYRNRTKKNSDFQGKDLRRSNCYNCDFTESNFDQVSFRGAQFKSCTFDGSTFDSAECVSANFKNSRFKGVQFENTIFDTVNLEQADFEGATFTNVLFVNTDLSTAKNMDLEGQDVQVYEGQPEFEISSALYKAVKSAMHNDHIKYARVLDTKEGKVNTVMMMLLLSIYNEETIIKGLGIMKKNLKEDFSTLSGIINLFESYEDQGLL